MWPKCDIQNPAYSAPFWAPWWPNFVFKWTVVCRQVHTRILKHIMISQKKKGAHSGKWHRLRSGSSAVRLISTSAPFENTVSSAYQKVAKRRGSPLLELADHLLSLLQDTITCHAAKDFFSTVLSVQIFCNYFLSFSFLVPRFFSQSHYFPTISHHLKS